MPRTGGVGVAVKRRRRRTEDPLKFRKEGLIGIDAHVRRAGGLLQQRGTEEEQRICWFMEGARCFGP